MSRPGARPPGPERVLRRLRVVALRREIGADLRRHRDMLVLAVSLLALGPGIVGWPLLQIAQPVPGQGLLALAAGALLLGAMLLWVHAFRRSIGGGAFHAWLQTLPVPAAVFVRLDAIALLLADLPLWLVLGASVIALRGHAGATAPGGLARALLATAACMLAQRALLRPQRGPMAAALLAVAWLAGAVAARGDVAGAVLAWAGVAACVALLCGCWPAAAGALR